MNRAFIIFIFMLALLPQVAAADDLLGTTLRDGFVQPESEQLVCDHVAEAAPGQTIWIRPSAMLVDDNRRGWLNLDDSYAFSQDQNYFVQVLIVDREPVDHYVVDTFSLASAGWRFPVYDAVGPIGFYSEPVTRFASFFDLENLPPPSGHC